MIDREKVIHAVETAFELWIDEYTGCSWFKEDEVRQAKEDAIAILKEQEAVVRCKDCAKQYTDNCLLYWDDINTPDNWYCANGERKETT